MIGITLCLGFLLGMIVGATWISYMLIVEQLEYYKRKDR